MKIGLFFGSFNPIHNAHISIGKYFIKNSPLDKIWFVISPMNPFKKDHNLLPAHQRLELIQIALENVDSIEASEVELNMPTPSYTINTLRKLWHSFPQDEFSIIMGTDNLLNLDKWMDHQTILEKCKLYVYPRTDTDGGTFKAHPSVIMASSEFLKISSTEIREKIQSDGAASIIPEKVLKKIKEKKYYS